MNFTFTPTPAPRITTSAIAGLEAVLDLESGFEEDRGGSSRVGGMARRVDRRSSVASSRFSVLRVISSFYQSMPWVMRLVPLDVLFSNRVRPDALRCARGLP